MSIVAASIIDTATFKPALIQCNYLVSFKDALVKTKEANHYIFNMKKRGNVRKAFKLNSGFIVMYDDFWGQCTLIAIFEFVSNPIRQRVLFERIKALVAQNKSLANINKKFTEVKLGILDIMTGRDGIDKLNSKSAEAQTQNLTDYEKALFACRSLVKQKEFSITEAKQAITRKFSKLSNPFGAFKQNISSELAGYTDDKSKSSKYCRGVDLFFGITDDIINSTDEDYELSSEEEASPNLYSSRQEQLTNSIPDTETPKEQNLNQESPKRDVHEDLFQDNYNEDIIKGKEDKNQIKTDSFKKEKKLEQPPPI